MPRPPLPAFLPCRLRLARLAWLAPLLLWTIGAARAGDGPLPPRVVVHIQTAPLPRLKADLDGFGLTALGRGAPDRRGPPLSRSLRLPEPLLTEDRPIHALLGTRPNPLAEEGALLLARLLPVSDLEAVIADFRAKGNQVQTLPDGGYRVHANRPIPGNYNGFFVAAHGDTWAIYADSEIELHAARELLGDWTPPASPPASPAATAAGTTEAATADPAEARAAAVETSTEAATDDASDTATKDVAEGAAGDAATLRIRVDFDHAAEALESWAGAAHLLARFQPTTGDTKRVEDAKAPGPMGADGPGADGPGADGGEVSKVNRFAAVATSLGRLGGRLAALLRQLEPGEAAVRFGPDGIHCAGRLRARPGTPLATAFATLAAHRSDLSALDASPAYTQVALAWNGGGAALAPQSVPLAEALEAILAPIDEARARSIGTELRGLCEGGMGECGLAAGLAPRRATADRVLLLTLPEPKAARDRLRRIATDLLAIGNDLFAAANLGRPLTPIDVPLPLPALGPGPGPHPAPSALPGAAPADPSSGTEEPRILGGRLEAEQLARAALKGGIQASTFHDLLRLEASGRNEILIATLPLPTALLLGAGPEYAILAETARSWTQAQAGMEAEAGEAGAPVPWSAPALRGTRASARGRYNLWLTFGLAEVQRWALIGERELAPIHEAIRALPGSVAPGTVTVTATGDGTIQGTAHLPAVEVDRWRLLITRDLFEAFQRARGGPGGRGGRGGRGDR